MLYSRGAGIAGYGNTIPSRSFVFELPKELEKKGFFYLRLSSATDVRVNLDFLSFSGFYNSNLAYFSGYGIVYGLLISMILYNFFIFFVLKKGVETIQFVCGL